MGIKRKIAGMLTVVMLGTVLPYNALPVYALDESEVIVGTNIILNNEIAVEEAKDTLLADDSNIMDKVDEIVDATKDKGTNTDDIYTHTISESFIEAELQYDETNISDNTILRSTPMSTNNSVTSSTSSGTLNGLIRWSLDEEGTLIISGTGQMPNYSMFPWEGIKAQIIKVVIENGITSVAGSAFNNCGHLKTVLIPQTVTVIEGSAFENCEELTTVGLSNGLKFINMRAFANCKGIKKITIPSTVTNIFESAFQGCTGLESVYVPNSVIGISAAAFRECVSLKAIYLPPSIEYINQMTFWGCSSLKSVRLPENVKSIGAGAFNGCENLSMIDIPESCTGFGICTFANCKSLKQICIPQGAFYLCDTFENCSNLSDIWLPKNIETIDENTFKGCSKLKDVYYEGEEVDWNEIDILDGNEALLNAKIHYNSEKIAKSIIEDCIQDLDSKEYSPSLSYELMKLSDAAYNKDNITSAYERLGFKTYQPYNYKDSEYESDSVAFTIGKKKNTLSGETLVLIVIRGSVHALDWSSNFHVEPRIDVWHAGFETASDKVYKQLCTYLSGLPKTNVKYVITGHSRGAAVGNILSMRLFDEGVDSKDVYDYNFACPNVAVGLHSKWSWFGEHDNIININNRVDPVPFMPGNLMSVAAPMGLAWGRYGMTYWFTGKNYVFSNTFNQHGQNTYLNFLQEYPSTEQFTNNIGDVAQDILRGFAGYCSKFLCPVDVEIVDEKGNVVASIKNGIVTNNSESGKVVAWIDGDKKYVYVSGLDDWSFRLIGTDTGEMTYIASKVNLISENVEEEKIFEKVQLKSGKTMYSDIAKDFNCSDVKLYVIDDKGKTTKEVKEDGTEVDYSKYGDVLPEDIPDDGKIPEGIWIAGVEDKEYTGNKVTLSFRVYDGMKLLNEKIDYTVSYKNNNKVYTLEEGDQGFDTKKAPSVTVTGKGNYDCTEVVYFKILPQDISGTDFTADDITLAATGKKQTIKPALYWKDKALKNKTDYTFNIYDTAENPHGESVTDIGNYVLRFSGSGNFTGTRDIKLRLTSDYTLVSKLKVGKVSATAWTGNPITPEPEVYDGKTLLEKGKHYALSYASNVDPGTGYVIITGNPDNGYAGSRRVSFKITAPKSAKAGVYDISEAKDTDKRINIDYSKTVPFMKGGAKPTVTVKFKTDDGKTQKLVEGRDYKVSYKNNTSYGGGKTPLVVVSGAGNFKGKREMPFAITEKNLSNVTLLADDKSYKNKANSYTTKVTLTDEDEKNLSSGKDYEKDIKYTYIYDTKVKVNGADVQRNAGDLVDKQDIIPADTVIRVTATAKAGSGYTGTVSGTYRIVTANISSAKVTIPTQVYNGKPITLAKKDISLAIKGTKLSEDDYEIVGYSNNINKGTAKVTIRGTGNYGGLKTQTFKIKAKGFKWWWRK